MPSPASVQAFLATSTDIVPVQSLPTDARDCSICQETYPQTGSITSGADIPVRIQPCGHIFGAACLRSHVTGNQNYSSKCPMCRAPLFGASPSQLLDFMRRISPFRRMLDVTIDTYNRLDDELQDVQERGDAEIVPAAEAAIVSGLIREQMKFMHRQSFELAWGIYEIQQEASAAGIQADELDVNFDQIRQILATRGELHTL